MLRQNRTQRLLVLGTTLLMIGVVLAIADDGVTLETSSESYDLGEVVPFTLTNGTDVWLTMFYDPPWEIFYLPPDSLLAPCGAYTVELYLGPGDSRDYEWDQINCWTEEQTIPGTYRVEIHYALDTGRIGVVGRDQAAPALGSPRTRTAAQIA